MCSRCAENKAVGEARRRGHVEYNLVYRRDRLPPGDRAYLRVASLRDEADVWAHFARQHRMSLSALAREAIRAYIDLADDADDD